MLLVLVLDLCLPTWALCSVSDAASSSVLPRVCGVLSSVDNRWGVCCGFCAPLPAVVSGDRHSPPRCLRADRLSVTSPVSDSNVPYDV